MTQGNFSFAARDVRGAPNTMVLTVDTLMDGVVGAVRGMSLSSPSSLSSSGSQLSPCGSSAAPTLKGKNAPCTHNSWDNVRVIKGQVTLRCRLCQLQWRTHVDAVWRKRKCGFFNTAQGCSLGARCTKIHMHAKKQSLEERVERHGDGVRSTVPVESFKEETVGVPSEEVPERAPARSAQPARSAKPQTLPTKVNYSRPCVHNSWDNVRVKKGMVTLRCRVCQEQWKRNVADVERCTAFPDCPMGDACTKVHMHVFKMSLEERQQEHPDLVAAVPAAVAPVVEAARVEVFSRGVPLNWPTAPLVEGVQAWYDSTACYSNVASWAGATLVQGTSMPIPSGPLVLKLTSVDPSLCAMVHAVHSGAFSTALEMHGWVRVQTAPMPRIGAQEAVMHSFAVKPSLLPNGMFSLPSAEGNVMCSVFVSFQQPLTKPKNVPAAAAAAPMPAPKVQYIEREDIYGNDRGMGGRSPSHTSAAGTSVTGMSASQTQLSISASASECSTEDDHHSESEKTPTASRGRSHARGGRQSPRGSTPDAHSSDDDCDSDHDAAAQRSSSCPPVLCHK